MSQPRVVIVSPALAAANNGNWHTAARWQRFLSTRAQTDVRQQWQGEPADALIALHARRSAESIARFRDDHPERPLALVLTGTDLYRDIETDQAARHSLECASHLIVLQPEGIARLGVAERAKARVIVQSASRLVRRDQPSGSTNFVAVGHLRDEKDPLTLMAAARRLRESDGIRVVHIGAALDPALGEAARRTMHDCPHYRWLGGLPPAAARRRIARAHALVHMSRIEGGANVVIEAVRSQVPVLASRIDGNVGLLGRDYAGCFAPGDAAALAALMQRFAGDAGFGEELRRQCALREPAFSPSAEMRAVRGLLADMLGDADAAWLRQSALRSATRP